MSESKTFIQPITKPILHLGFYYKLTQTGKVVILADPRKVKHERKKILRMVKLVKAEELKKQDVDTHFKAWKVSVRYGNSNNLIHKLNVWYDGLWERG